MKLAIDASRSLDTTQKTGVEVVSDELLRALATIRPANVEITYYTPQKISWLPAAQQRIVPGHHFWTIWHLSQALRYDRPDALFVPVHAMPWWLPAHTVRIIHDVAFLRAPKTYSLRERTYMRLDLWRAKKFCQAIIVPTEAVKTDLVKLAGFPPEKIIATGWGIPGNNISEPVGHAGEAITRQPCVLFIGRIEEKKNISNLIRAFNIFKKTHPDWRLILAGKPGHGYETIAPLLKSPGVEELGYISDQHKQQLLAEASILTLVSQEEGFAFPMLEAFRAGVPVVASNIPVLLEVGADACLYATPDSPAAIADCLAKVADHPATQATLVTAGKQRLQNFSWNHVAEIVWKTFLK